MQLSRLQQLSQHSLTLEQQQLIQQLRLQQQQLQEQLQQLEASSLQNLAPSAEGTLGVLAATTATPAAPADTAVPSPEAVDPTARPPTTAEPVAGASGETSTGTAVSDPNVAEGDRMITEDTAPTAASTTANGPAAVIASVPATAAAPGQPTAASSTPAHQSSSSSETTPPQQSADAANAPQPAAANEPTPAQDTTPLANGAPGADSSSGTAVTEPVVTPTSINEDAVAIVQILHRHTGEMAQLILDHRIAQSRSTKAALDITSRDLTIEKHREQVAHLEEQNRRLQEQLRSKDLGVKDEILKYTKLEADMERLKKDTEQELTQIGLEQEKWLAQSQVINAVDARAVYAEERVRELVQELRILKDGNHKLQTAYNKLLTHYRRLGKEREAKEWEQEHRLRLKEAREIQVLRSKVNRLKEDLDQANKSMSQSRSKAAKAEQQVSGFVPFRRLLSIPDIPFLFSVSVLLTSLSLLGSWSRFR